MIINTLIWKISRNKNPKVKEDSNNNVESESDKKIEDKTREGLNTGLRPIKKIKIIS